MNNTNPQQPLAQPHAEPASSITPKAWSLTSILLYWLNITGIVLVPVVIVLFNRYLVLPQLEKANAQLPALSTWFFELTMTAAAIPFVILAVALSTGQFFIKDKRITSALNLLVALAVGLVLAAWVFTVVLAFVAALN